jgi:hypothetical protein
MTSLRLAAGSSSPSTSPADLPSSTAQIKLPQELLETIITHISLANDISTLLSCTLLCKSLVPCARFRLFHYDRPSSAALRTFSLLHCKRRDLSDIDEFLRLLRSPLCTFTRVLCELGLTIAGITSTMGTRLLRNQIPYDPRDVNRLFEILEVLLNKEREGLLGADSAAEHSDRPGRIELKRLVIENLEWGDLTKETENVVRQAAERVTEGLNLKQVWFGSRTVLGGENAGGAGNIGERQTLEVLSWFRNVRWIKWSDLNAYWHGTIQQFFHIAGVDLNTQDGGPDADVGAGTVVSAESQDDEQPVAPLPNLQTFLISATSLHSRFTRAFALNLARDIKSLVVIQNQTQLINLSYVNEYLVMLGANLREITYDLSAFVSFARQIGYDARARKADANVAESAISGIALNHDGSQTSDPRVLLNLQPLTGLTTLSFGRIQILPDPIWQVLPQTYNEAVNPCRFLATVTSAQFTTIEFNLEFIPHPLGSPGWTEENEGEGDLVDKIEGWMEGFGWRAIDQAIRTCPGFDNTGTGSSCPVDYEGTERRCVRIGLFPGRYADTDGCMGGVEKLIRNEMPWCDSMGYLYFEVGRRYRTVCDRGDTVSR